MTLFEKIGGSLIPLAIICILLALIVLKLVWPGVRARRLDRERFQRLAVANGLTGDEIRTLHRLGAMKFPHDPLLIFVSPSGFDAAAGALAVEASSLREKLFGPTA